MPRPRRSTLFPYTTLFRSEVEDGAWPIREPPPRADQRDEHERVPERLVEEGRVEVLVPRVLQRAVRGGNVELPGQVGGGAEGLLVEEVAPAPDGLADRRSEERRVG